MANTFTPDEIADIRAEYPQYAYLLDDPIIADILLEAAQGNYDEVKLFGMLYDTDWWKTTSASVRAWEALVNTDPASAAANIENKLYEGVNYLNSLGLQLDPAVAQQIAKNSLEWGWSQDKYWDTLITASREFDSSPAVTSDWQSYINDVTKLSTSYLMNLSPSSLEAYAWDISEGKLTIAQLENAFKEQAKASYSWFAPNIDDGYTIEQILRPLQDTLAQTLEINPFTIDWTDPKWNSYIAFDDGSGQLRQMTLTEATRAAKQDPLYAYTDAAMNTAQRFVLNIFDEFGVM
jgi:hypothetical protein